MKTLIFLSFCILFISGCGYHQTGDRQHPDNMIDSLSQCPYLTTDQHGNPVISYLTDLNDSVSVMRYRISEDGGKTFGVHVEIPASKNVHPNAENLPKIIFKPNNEIIAVWGSSHPQPDHKYAGKVYYAQSFDKGLSWTGARALVSDSTSYDQRYFDLALLPDGEAVIIWLDNREVKEQTGSGIFYAATNGKNGFVNERMIGESICPCCRTELYVDTKGFVHAAFRDIINDSIRDMVHIISTDMGKTFSEPRRISADNWVINGCPHTGPSMTGNRYGLHFTWFTGGEPAGVFYCNSTDNGKNFYFRDSVSDRSSAKHPQIAVSERGRLAIVWDETVQHGTQYNSRIGFQKRNQEGLVTGTGYITADSVVSQFPVILAVAPDMALVAYTQQKGAVRSVRCLLAEF